MATIRYTLTRGNEEIDLEIDYTVAPYNPGRTWGCLPEDYEPPSGGEIEDMFIAGPDGSEFTPTDAELQEIERHIYWNHDYSED